MSLVHQKQDITEPSHKKGSLDSLRSHWSRKFQGHKRGERVGGLTWDVRRRKIEINEDDGKPKWSVKVDKLYGMTTSGRTAVCRNLVEALYIGRKCIWTLPMQVMQYADH